MGETIPFYQPKRMAIDAESYILILNTLNTYSAPSTASEKAALFAEDGSLTVHGGEKFTGKSTIEEVFRKFDKSKRPGLPYRHHLSSIKITLSSNREAEASSYFLVMGNTAPDHWGIYRDTLVRLNGEWLFKTRTITIEGAEPDGWIGSGASPLKFDS